MREINKIIIHCSDSTFGSKDKIDEWHKERGFYTKGIDGKVYHCGYHFVINNGFKEKGIVAPDWDGVLERGRPEGLVGAHCRGENSKSIGIALVGVDKFTESQFDTLTLLLRELMLKYDIKAKNIYGHNAFNQDKSCPNFSVPEFVYTRIVGGKL